MAKSKQGFRWTPSEEAFVRANDATMTAADMAARLGRTESAVKSWRAKNGVGVRPEIDAEAYIRSHWDSMSTQRIATVVRMTQHAVRDLAERMGLDPKPGGGLPKPRGFRPAQVIWARQNRGDKEADLILGFVERPDGVAKGVRA